jgi:tryptophan 2,3-dioxygenase
MYHQITELYFKLSLHECKQIAAAQPFTAEFFTARVQRINRYFEALTQFVRDNGGWDGEGAVPAVQDVVVAGKWFPERAIPHDRDIRYRFYQPGGKDQREQLRTASIEEQFEHIYWKLVLRSYQPAKKRLR